MPTPLVESTDQEAWLAARRTGVTATEVHKLAKSGASKLRVGDEKLTGKHADLSRNRYAKRGHTREPIIAAWVEQHYGIHPSTMLYASDEPRWALATPDGVQVDPFDGEVVLAEIKTSNKDLTPGPVGPDNVLIMELVDGTWRKGHFWKMGYYDQMQWAMFVMGATRTLFAYEQHDDQWPNPRPLEEQPRTVWVLRDEARIAELVPLAATFYAEVIDAPPASEDTPEEWVEIELIAGELLEARVRENDAKSYKEGVWKHLQALIADRDDFKKEFEGANVTWSTTHPDKSVVDMEAAVAADPELVAQFQAVSEAYRNLLARHTTTAPGEAKHTLTVTAPKK